MMRRGVAWRGDFRSTPKFGDEFTTVISRNTTRVDHLLVDIGPLAGAAGRFAKGLAGADRDAETIQSIQKTLFGVILRKYQPTKSLSLFFDGSDPLWKLSRSRRGAGKKFTSRFYRSCASPMPFMAEEKLRVALADTARAKAIPEFLIAGAGTPGPAEAKMSAFLWDLAARARDEGTSSSSSAAGAASGMPVPAAGRAVGPPSVSASDSVLVMGQEDSFLVALGALPFQNISTALLDQRDVKALTLAEGFAWLTLDQRISKEGASSASSSSEQVARFRLDATVLFLLADGCSATELGGVGAPLADVVQGYTDLLAAASPSTPASSAAAAGSEAPFLAVVMPHPHHQPSESAPSAPVAHTVGLSLGRLDKLLQRLVKRSPNPREDRSAADHLEALLQSLAMLAAGHGNVPNAAVVPLAPADAAGAAPAPMRPEVLLAHVRYLIQQHQKQPQQTPPATSATLVVAGPASVGPVVLPSWQPDFALTAAEQLLVCGTGDTEGHLDTVRAVAPVFSGGFALPEAAIADAFAAPDALASAAIARDVWSLVDPSAVGTGSDGEPTAAHPAVRHQPSSYFFQARTQGPPVGYDYAPVVLGGRARASGTLQAFFESNLGGDSSSSGSSVLGAGSSTAPPLVGFDAATKQWGPLKAPAAAAEALSAIQKTLRVVTWNVQFNRHSGETTPLGRPGVDWFTRTRYYALEAELKAQNADVIAMQEVEPTWWEHLSQCPWVREEYVFSCDQKGEAISPYGQLFLIHRRVPVVDLKQLNVAGFTGQTSVMPVLSIRLKPTVPPLSIANLHLLAPYSDNNIAVRQQQLSKLTTLLSPKRMPGDVLVMGDFNDFPEHYFTWPDEHRMIDAWDAAAARTAGSSTGTSSTNSSNLNAEEAYTINGKVNTLARHIIEPQFFGRADRIYVRGGAPSTTSPSTSSSLRPTRAALIGTTAVRAMQVEYIVKHQMPCPDYLFPSDHFGVAADFEIII